MDPYLENPELWRGFHHHFAEEVARCLIPLVGPKYYADVEVRATTEDVEISTIRSSCADVGVVEIKGGSLAAQATSPRASVAAPTAPIRRAVLVPELTKQRAVRLYRTETGRLVTSVEILSPFNKKSGEGVETYREKRSRLLRAPVHLIELDLLRGGERPGPEVCEPELACEYVILLNRAVDSDLRTSEIWPVELKDALPPIPVPLLDPDPDVLLDLGRVFAAVYEAFGYSRRINYKQAVPPPPLRKESYEWMRAHMPGTGQALPSTNA